MATPKQAKAITTILDRNRDYRWIAEMWERVPKWQEGYHEQADNRQLILAKWLEDMPYNDAYYFIAAWKGVRGYHKTEAFKRLGTFLNAYI